MLKSYTANTAAYELYLKGRCWWNKRTVGGLKKAVEYFEQAVALSPNYALAYAGLADCYTLLSILEAMPPQEAFPKARASAVKALEIDETLAEARASLGWVKWVYDWDWPGSEREFRRAIEISPDYATAYDWYGVCLAQTGQFDEALAQLKHAQRLDPLSPVIQVHIGVMAASSVNHRHLAGLAHIYTVSGKRSDARKLLGDLLEREKNQYVSPYSIAMVYVGLEDKEQAFVWLRKGFDQRAGRMVRLKFDPRFKKFAV